MFFEKKNESRFFDISWSAIIKFALAFFVIYLLWLVKDILVLVLFGLIISVLFDPAIDFLQRFRVSRPLAVVAVYFSIIGLIGYFFYVIAPIFVTEIQQFSQLFPVYFEKVAPFFLGLGFEIFKNLGTFTEALRAWLVGASASIVSSIAAFFGGLFLTVTVFTIAIFFSLEEKGIEKMIRLIFKKKHADYLDIWKKSEAKIARWFGVKFLMMLMVGVSTSILCLALDVKYPILFGVLAGVADIIPIIGPIVAGTTLTLFVLIGSWQKAILAAVIFTVIQQVEGNILTPLLAKKFIELPPILVIVAIMVGDRFWGIGGVVFAIPLFAIFYDLTRTYLEGGGQS